MDKNLSFEFVTHASIIISTDEVKLICDPWLYGSAFNNGWDLLCDYKFDMNRFADITHIWFSHEHPDHFSPIVIKAIPEEFRKKITVLYQNTKDKKVVDFCKNLGFNIIELTDNLKYNLTPTFEVTCANVPFFDSWLLMNIDGVKVLNINDCVVDGDGKVEKIEKATGPVDVMFTQFSYAGWKGNKDKIELRKQVAKDKLEIVTKQIKAFKPKFTIPFASFVYFSHVENSFMNDAVNWPELACKTMEQAGTKPILLYPADKWNYDESWNNAESLEKYNELYKNIPNRTYRVATKSFSEEELIDASNIYIKRLKEKNSWTLVTLAKHMPFLGFFKPTNILLYDIETVMVFDINNGLQKSNNQNTYDIKMHSESLIFIFNYDFGFETLTVNGRFEADFEGLKKMTKMFGIGPLNNMGKYINSSLLLKDNIVFEFFKILFRTKKMMKD